MQCGSARGAAVPATRTSTRRFEAISLSASGSGSSGAKIHEQPAYAILNACRTLAWLRDGAFRSKEEGGLWALAELSPELREPVKGALSAYRGASPDIDRRALDRFAAFAHRAITDRRTVPGDS